MSDSATFETTRREVRPVLVKLRGEFDVLSQKILAGTLSDCLASGRVTLVDLSGVAFMDSGCVRELALYYQLGKERVALCVPSQELELSVAACDLEDWTDFVYTTGLERSLGQRRGKWLPRSGNKDEKGDSSAHTIHGGKS